jgi:hypothetical protein
MQKHEKVAVLGLRQLSRFLQETKNTRQLAQPVNKAIHMAEVLSSG